jgi:signal transduction histidine kinase
MDKPKLRVLLVDDDEDDFVLVRDLLAEIPQVQYVVRWISGREEALAAMTDSRQDICLLDYHLGQTDGIELLREAARAGCRSPIIVLTGFGDREVDARALEAGAVDFLSKEELSAPLLDRSIRYAVRQGQILESLRAAEGRARQLSSDLLCAQEAERKRIAGELHDSVGQALAAAKFAVENGLQQMSRGSVGEAEATLGRVVSMLRAIAEEAHRIQNDLRPRMLEDLGIVETLGWFCREFQQTYAGIRIDCRIGVREDQVPAKLAGTVFRIVQEACNNVARHSKADRIQLDIRVDGHALVLGIRDNGQGFELVVGRKSEGMGLSSMKGRAELSGGTFCLETGKEKGTELVCKWPLALVSGLTNE